MIPKFDSQFVNATAFLEVRENKIETLIEYTLNDCTEEDWALFYPNEIETANTISATAEYFNLDQSDVLASFKCVELN